MVNGDIDNCDVARCGVVEAVTPLRLGLPVSQRLAGSDCATVVWRVDQQHCAVSARHAALSEPSMKECVRRLRVFLRSVAASVAAVI
ncbi:hypothetical protein XarjCFBP7652_06905 [Xanthomonas arboricola]|nr:hypothetical protein XarjCFBP7652_06905 [Xanthomonas arboricola]